MCEKVKTLAQRQPISKDFRKIQIILNSASKTDNIFHAKIICLVEHIKINTKVDKKNGQNH